MQRAFLDVCPFLHHLEEILTMPDLGSNQNPDGTLKDPNLNADGTPKIPDPPLPGAPDKDKEFFQVAAREASKLATDTHRRNLELEAELEALKQKASGGNKEEITKDQFYADPVNVVKRLMDEAIAPLKDVASNLGRRDALVDVKARFRNNPKWKPVFDKAEHLIDQAMSKNDPTDANMYATLLAIRGASAAKEIDIDFDERPTLPNQPPVSGNLPPSAPPPPVPLKPTRRPLTESEKRMARTRNLTDDQYLDIMDGTDEISFADLNKVLTEAEIAAKGVK